MQIRYHAHSNAYLEICRCYLNLYNTEVEAIPPLAHAIASPEPTPEDVPYKLILKKVIW